jgi:hypothetical protein
VEDPTGPTTLYVSAPVDLPPLTAAAAFDAVSNPATEAECGIRLDPVPAAMVADFTIRRATARLRVAGRVTVGVEVELVIWSDDRCEIGIRPVGRLISIGGGRLHNRYLDVARGVAPRLADAMVEVADDWMAWAWSSACHPSRYAA